MALLTIIVILLSLIFDFLNGIHDSSNVVATMISSRAMSPRFALSMTAVANFVGPFIFGVAVANTIGHEIVDADAINLQVLVAALVSAIFWNLLTWYLGFPSSSSHALIGGFIGAVVVGAGCNNITGCVGCHTGITEFSASSRHSTTTWTERENRSRRKSKGFLQ